MRSGIAVVDITTSGRAERVADDENEGAVQCLCSYIHLVHTTVRLADGIVGYKADNNEPEVTAKISRIPKVRIYEVGISYYGRTYEEGKKIGWRDGFRAIWCILKYNIWSKK